MSTQNQDLFGAFAETVAPDHGEEPDDILETLTYIAFLIENIASSLDEAGTPERPAREPREPRHQTATTRRVSGVADPTPVTRNIKKGGNQPQSEAAPVRATRQEEPRLRGRTAGVPPSTVPVDVPPDPSPKNDDEGKGKSKSQEQLDQERQESVEQKQGNGLLDTLKRNLAGWDGGLDADKNEGLQDVVGTAVGGPLFAAAKEIAHLVETDKDDTSLLGALKKTFEDKTGITASKKWIEEKKEGVRSKIQGWAGSRQESVQAESPGGGQASVQEATQSGPQRDVRGRFISGRTDDGRASVQAATQDDIQERPALNRMDAGQKSQATTQGNKGEGRFLLRGNRRPKPLPPQPTQEEKEQLELTEALLTGQVAKAKLDGQRHEEILRAISRASGGGLLDQAKGAMDLLRGKGESSRSSDREGASRSSGRGRPGRSRGGVLARVRRGGASLLRGLGFDLPEESSDPPDSGEWEGGRNTSRNGRRAGSGLFSRARALGSRGMALGAKGLLGAAKLVPVAGQILSAGMAISDGLQGWNDTEGQKAAFGLADGESVTTGQKASFTAASALDMGGLLTGGAQMLGFDIDTADIAKGLYDAASFAGTVAETVASSASGIASSLADGFSRFTGTVGAKAEELWNAASSVVSSSVSAATESAQGLLDSTKTTVSDAISAISTKSSELWNAATSTLSEAATATGEKASSLLDSALSWAGFGSTKKDAIPAIALPQKPQTSAAATTPQTPSAPQTKGTPVTAEEHEPATATPPPTESVHGAGEKQAMVVSSEQPVTPQAEVRPVPMERSGNTATTIGRAAHTRQDSAFGNRQSECVLSEPGEEMVGMFGSLVLSLNALKDVIETTLADGTGDSSILTSVQGMVSNVGSWVDGLFSRSSSSGEGSQRNAGNGSSPRNGSAKGSASKYVYNPNAQIGEAIARYESGTQGSSAIGYDGTGGTSYGKYQLASKAGSMEGFLKMMEAKGGEQAAIAARLRAAGPANTGSKQGAMPDQWKKEAAANSELLQSAEREYMLKANYAPAMQGLGGDLRSRVEGSKALQEAMFSTSVQHGPGRTSGIWNKVYKEGMSDEDLVRAVYSERATRFGSSTPQVQESARRRMLSEQEVILSILKGESSTQPGTVVANDGTQANVVQNNSQDQAVKAATSASIQDSTQKAMDRGVGYNLSSKNSQSGVIDCSGWVAEINRDLMTSINAAMGQEVYGTEARQILDKGAAGGAAGIIQAVSGATGELLGNADLTPDKVREGMMIGMDTGNRKGEEPGRFKGIDHITQTYRDPSTGKMMVSESRGGKGVMTSEYDTWYAKNAKTAKLYGTDVNKLADASKIIPAQQATAEATVPLTSASLPAQVQTAGIPIPPIPAPVQSVVAESRRVPEPEIISKPATQPQSSNFSTIEKLLLELICAVREQNGTGNAQTSPSKKNDILVEYDDPYLVQMAHDRA